MKYSFITQYKNTYPIRLMCQVLGVDRTSYYHDRRQRDNTPDDPEHPEMLEWVRRIDEASDHSYASRRMKRALNCRGYPVSRNKARKLMREAEVQVRHRKKYKATTNSHHKQPVFDNLLQRQFDVPQPDQVYAADVTSVWTESFFGSLKQERVQGRNYPTRYEAQQDILHYLSMFHNPWRLHSTLGYISPNDYEKQLLEIKKVASLGCSKNLDHVMISRMNLAYLSLSDFR